VDRTHKKGKKRWHLGRVGATTRHARAATLRRTRARTLTVRAARKQPLQPQKNADIIIHPAHT
jgi:hypothetical protein